MGKMLSIIEAEDARHVYDLAQHLRAFAYRHGIRWRQYAYNTRVCETTPSTATQEQVDAIRQLYAINLHKIIRNYVRDRPQDCFLRKEPNERYVLVTQEGNRLGSMSWVTRTGALMEVGNMANILAEIRT